MIVVIADDFSGAAEIGSIGFCAGLRTQVQTDFSPDCQAELLVLDTNSRSCPPSEAASRVRKTVRQIKEAGIPIDWLYKKTDSVLRGPVAAELLELMKILKIPRVLLVPANPSKGRIVRDGRYFVNQQPLDQTEFAKDPEYPAFTSDVLDLLGLSSSPEAGVLKPGQKPPDRGIRLGQAETSRDLQVWADCLEPQTLAAGAADFFTAILQAKGFRIDAGMSRPSFQARPPALFVFGSGSAYSRTILQEARRRGRTVYRMPDEVFSCADRFSASELPVQRWAEQIAAAFEKEGCVAAAIDRPAVSAPLFARTLAAVTAIMVQDVSARIRIRDYYIEGGATASAVIRRLGWSRFDISARPAPGVVQMRIAEKEDSFLTVKPGSYPWPEPILNLFLKGISCANGNPSLD